MEKGTKIMVLIWAILALISFVGSWFTPLWFFKVCGWAFGGMNLFLGFSMILGNHQAKIEAQKETEIVEEKPKRGRPKKEKEIE